MSPESVASNCLEDRFSRACARLAMRATLDTLYGGALAAVYAKRLSAMGSSIPANDIVSDIYSRSTGTASERWGAWACNECGSVYLGIENAAQCCTSDEDWDYNCDD